MDDAWPPHAREYGSHLVELDPSRYRFSLELRWQDNYSYPSVRLHPRLPAARAHKGDAPLVSAAMLLHKARVVKEDLHRLVALGEPPREIMQWTIASTRLSHGAVYRQFIAQDFRDFLNFPRPRELSMPVDFVVHAPLVLRPHFTTEPVLSLFLGMALACRWRRMTLERALGAEELGRLRRPGRAARLAEEMADTEGLFWGAAVTTARELGTPMSEALDMTFRSACALVGVDPECESALGSGRGTLEDVRAFESWRENLDVDMAEDVRRMEPAATQSEDGKVQVQATLGWAKLRLRAEFAHRPAKSPVLRILDGGRDVTREIKVGFGATTVELWYPFTLTMSVPRQLSRAEMRAVCDDAGGDVDRIWAALTAGDGGG